MAGAERFELSTRGFGVAVESRETVGIAWFAAQIFDALDNALNARNRWYCGVSGIFAGKWTAWRVMLCDWVFLEIDAILMLFLVIPYWLVLKGFHHKLYTTQISNKPLLPSVRKSAHC